MTTRTIFVPVLIETAAQAEALPIGTPVVHYPRHGMEDQAGVRVRGGWEFTGTNPDTFGHQEAVGMEALVPVEAEEEWEDDGRPVWSLGDGQVTPADADDYARRNGRRPSRRLVIPEETA